MIAISPRGTIHPTDEEGDNAFDEPCLYGYRVGQHSVYCYNETWEDAPRKCSWRWGTVQEHERCPGYSANPKMANRCAERK